MALRSFVLQSTTLSLRVRTTIVVCWGIVHGTTRAPLQLHSSRFRFHKHERQATYMFHKTKRPTNNKAINSPTTTNSFNMSQQKVYKDNLVHRIGGPMDFEMTIIDLCDRLMNDNILMQHFCRLLGKTTLYQFQTELLDFAFLDQSALENNHIDLRSIKLRLQRNIAACGLTMEHFDIIKNHFIESLRHSWCNSDVIEAAFKHLESITHMFGGDFVEALRKKQQSTFDSKKQQQAAVRMPSKSPSIATTTGKRYRM